MSMMLSVQDQISLLEEREAELKDRGESPELSALQAKLADLRGTVQVQQQREEKQAAELQDIQLPLDYNEAFGDPRANDAIIALIREAKEQLFTQHNAEIAELQASYQDKIRGTQDTLTTAQADTEALKAQIDTLTAAMLEKERTINQLTIERDDAYAKRDAAVRAKETAEAEDALKRLEILRLNGQIKDLEASLGAMKGTKKAEAGGVLLLSSTLRPLTEDEIKARANKQQIETINRNISEKWGIPPLKVPSLPLTPPQPEEQKEDQFQGNPADEQHAEGAGAVQEDVPGTDGAAPSGEVEEAAQPTVSEEIEARFRRIEEHLGLKTWTYEAE